MLGDTTYDDGTYTGDTGDSVLSVQYYRNKASEFQAIMVAMDQSYASLADTYDALLYVADDGTLSAIGDLMNQYTDKKGYFVAAAEAINLASSGLNAAGMRFPMLSYSSGLGAVPLVGIAAALAAAAALIIWGRSWINQVYETQRYALSLEAADQATKNRIAVNAASAQSAKDMADNPIGDVANIVKWGAIAVLGFLGFQAWQKSRA